MKRRQALQHLSLASGALLSGLPTLAFRDRKPLGVALVGLGNYATVALAPAFAHTKHCKLTGIVTGTPAKAERWAKDHNIPAKNIYNYETFDRIADNPDIDIVYVVLPNAMHAEYTIRAAQAGKHVICEKPMALNVAECQAMIDACRKAGVRLSIGYRLHFERHHQELMRMGQEELYGPIDMVQGSLAFRVRDPSLWRLDKALGGGGAIMDLGVYPIQAIRYATGKEPLSVTAQGYNTEPEIFRDIYETMSWQMEFPNGVIAQGLCSYGFYVDRLYITAPRGWMELQPSYNGMGTTGKTHKGPMNLPQVVQQALQMDDFVQRIWSGEPSPVSGEEGLKDMRIVEAIKRAVETGRKEEV